MVPLRRAFCIAAMIASAAVVASPASAQQPWPSRFVRLVVAGGSGTSADVAARVVSHHLAELWGQQVIVENRPGAGGVAGAASIAQSIPDGYSLLFSQSAPLSLSPHVVKPVPYDVERDFEPVIFIGMVPFVLASNEKLPVGNLAEFIAYARKEPGKVSFATLSRRKRSAPRGCVVSANGRHADGSCSLCRLSACHSGHALRICRRDLRPIP